MMAQRRQQITRILAVGAPATDGVRRLTQGEVFVCCEGDSAEHQDLMRMCVQIEHLIRESGMDLTDFSPRELESWIRAFVVGPTPA